MSIAGKNPVVSGQGPLFAGLAVSVCLHVGLLMPMGYQQITHAWSEQALQVHLVSPPTAERPVDESPAPPIEIAPHTLPEAESTDSAGAATVPEPQAQPAPSLPPPENQPTPASADDVRALTGDDLWVVELFPEQVGEFLLEMDPAINWHDLRTLRKRPLIRGELTLLMPEEYLRSNAGERAVVEIKVMEDGALHGVRLLTPESLFGRSLADSLAQLQFVPGEFRGERVPSVMYIEFKLPQQP